MNLPELDQSQLDHIAEEFSAAIRRGEAPSIEAFLARYHDPSGKLRGLLGSIEMIEGLKQLESDSPSAGPSEPLKIKQLDEYTIIREIGRGGMGVVLEAIHQSLGRRVAVKVLARGWLDENKHLNRFRREARAAARLRHSNIVPVFGVGHSGDHHYYVMDYIEGVSLRDWLASIRRSKGPDAPTANLSPDSRDGDLHWENEDGGHLDRLPDCSFLGTPPSLQTGDYFRWSARLIATVCDALQYAHTQGVLHRDIKPANLLIDRQGEVWIADFGLAKLTEQPGATVTGEIVGTPQYMPPEAFEGTYDVNSEIYGVGLTLYELLSGRQAIEGKSPADVIRKATLGVSISPRKLNPSVPRDLETITLKALSHDPRARYQTAGQLRDDLQCFLANRPISARRTSLAGRAIRWFRREPTVALLTFATFMLLLTLAIVSAAGYLRTSDALAVARSATQSAETALSQRTAALQAADEQRLRAEKNLQVALDAFDQVMQNIGDRGIEPDAEFLGEVTDATSPDVTPEDARLLQSLLGFFDQLASNNSQQLLQESAVAAQRAGDIYLRLGQLRQADRAYSDSLARYRRLADQQTDHLSFILAEAKIMNQLAVITGLRGQLGRTDQMFDQTLEVLEACEDAMASQAGRFEYARAHRLFASLGSRTGLDDVSVPRSAPAERSRRGLLRRPMGAMLKLRSEDDLSAAAEAIQTLDALIEQAPDEVRYRAELARAYRDKAKAASRARRPTESESAVRRSIELFEQLLAENPESDAVRYELAMTLSSTEAFSFNQIVRANRASELSAALLNRSPDLPRYQALRAHTLTTLAAHQQRIGRLDPAEENLLEALRIYHSLTTASPELNLYETRRSQTLESLADLRLRKGDPDAAIDYLKRAIRLLLPRLQRPDFSPVAGMQLQRMRQKLARIENQ